MVYYLGYYSCEKIETEQRVASPPAMNKMGYIISVLSEYPNIKILVVSPSETSIHCYVKGTLHNLSENVSLKTFDSFNSKNKLIRGVGHIWTKYQMVRFLMKNVKSDDTVIVYHSLVLMNVVRKLKKKKNFLLIVEAEEIYADVKENDALKKKEMDYLQIADKYIVITELLNKKVNKQNKPKIISHGTYRTVPKYSEKFDDGKVHVVYAGTFNPIKGGVYSAIEAAEYMDENYVLHILGKGSKAETEMVEKKISQISQISKCKIIFDGYKKGKDFDSFIQSCHIGLSTQQPDGKYNETSFPSKILMYMSNGLPVVSIRISAVESSDVSDYIFFYESSTPQNIARAIKSVPFNDVINIQKRINELNERFEKDLFELLK